MKAGLKKKSEQSDYMLTPWNHEELKQQNNINQPKKPTNTSSYFFKKRNYSEVDRTLEKTFSNPKYRHREIRSTVKCQSQQPLFAKTFNVTFESQSHLRTLTTDRLKRDFQNFVSRLTKRSNSKQKVLKAVSKSKTAKQLQTQFFNLSQRNSQACKSQRKPMKMQMIVRSHNNFFQTTIHRNKGNQKSKDSKLAEMLQSIRKNVIRDSDLKNLIKQTQSNFINQQI